MKRIIIIIYFILIPLNIFGYETKVAEEIIEINESYRLWNEFKIDMPILLYFERSGDIEIISKNKLNLKKFKVIKRKNGYFIYHKKGNLGSVPHFDLNYNLDGIKVYLYKIDYSETYEDSISIMFHEYFHYYQKLNFKNERDYKPIDDELPDKYNPYFFLETIYLNKALTSTDDNERRKNIGLFICVREKKYRTMKKKHIEFENGKERIEGSAKYVEIKSVFPNVGSMSYTAVARIFLSGGSIFSSQGNIVNFHYYSGAAQMFLLDYYNIPWKKQIENNENNIYDIIKENFRPINCSSCIRQYSDTVKYFKKAVSKLKTERISELDKIISNYKKHPYLLINFGHKFSTVPPKSYTSDIKMENERIFINPKVNFSKRGVDLSLNADICSLMSKRDDTKLDINAYRIPLKTLDEVNIETDERRYHINQINGEVKFKKISVDTDREGFVHLKSECPGSIKKSTSYIEIFIDCK
ncbi:MAG: hypothetical protein KA059_08840 [Elusimicrobiales bacterium]|nr:hypothetical protein [Elusimicrobiales bacterium]